jgi:hypothetical protein
MRSIEPGISRFRVWSFGPSRNDSQTQTRLHIPAEQFAPESINHSRLAIERAQGMPGTRCARSLGCKQKKHSELVTTGTAGCPGIPRANGFNGFLRARLGEPGLLSPLPARSSPRKLDISVGISGPHDFAVRVRAFVCCANRVHRIPCPTFRTMRNAPH